MQSAPRFTLLSMKGKTGALHATWFAFFLSFVVWFNHAPLMATVRDALSLSDQEVATLLMLNVALTIPARIVIGMLVDRYGPRLMYSLVLAISSFLCFAYAMADSFEALALTRFLLGFVGAGFVIGIRMIGEWFPAREVGLAQGIYGAGQLRLRAAHDPAALGSLRRRKTAGATRFDNGRRRPWSDSIVYYRLVRTPRRDQPTSGPSAPAAWR